MLFVCSNQLQKINSAKKYSQVQLNNLIGFTETWKAHHKEGEELTNQMEMVGNKTLLSA